MSQNVPNTSPFQLKRDKNICYICKNICYMMVTSLWSELTLVSAVCVLQSDTRLRGRAILLPQELLITPRKIENKLTEFSNFDSCNHNSVYLSKFKFCFDFVRCEVTLVLPGQGLVGGCSIPQSKQRSQHFKQGGWWQYCYLLPATTKHSCNFRITNV